MTLFQTLLRSDTKPTRLWLGLVNLTFAIYVILGADYGMQVQISGLPYEHADWIWAGLYVINGLFLLKGIGGQFNAATLVFEGILGWFLWTFAAVVNGLAQGFPGPTTVCALMATWILIRYPTHWGPRDD